MLRQPTSRIDPSRPSHFLRCDDALQLYGGSKNALIDLSNLALVNENYMKKASAVKRVKDKRDVDMSKDVKLRCWDSKKMKVFLKCFNCCKPCCFFSQSNNDGYKEVL